MFLFCVWEGEGTKFYPSIYLSIFLSLSIQIEKGDVIGAYLDSEGSEIFYLSIYLSISLSIYPRLRKEMLLEPIWIVRDQKPISIYLSLSIYIYLSLSISIYLSFFLSIQIEKGDVIGAYLDSEGSEIIMTFTKNGETQVYKYLSNNINNV